MTHSTIRRAQRKIRKINCKVGDNTQIKALLELAITLMRKRNPHGAAICLRQSVDLYHPREHATDLFCLEALDATTDALIQADRDAAPRSSERHKQCAV